MTPAATVLVPLLGGPVLWLAVRAAIARGTEPSRTVLAAAAGLLMATTTALAAATAIGRPSAGYRWGAGLVVSLAVDDPASVAVVLVPAVALVVLAYAAFHEEPRALGRLLATLVFFVGAMELLVLADDLLTLLMAWELVGACSWALIGHEWWERESGGAANHAFVVTHLGDLGLFVAAGAAMAGTGGLAYVDLGGLSGGWLSVFVAGVVLAAASKSAQVPFSPWLFSAMAGPTSVSALLHAATMVAAGSYLLIRLAPTVQRSEWAGPVIIAIGLVTALTGAVVALVQPHAKKLLAASTSAHYGFMFVAVGAGYPAAALAHLVAHAAFKAPLFLSAGIAIEGAGSNDLRSMRLGRLLPAVAATTGVCALALAAVPPLGGAWTKESVMSAVGKEAPWLAVVVAVAGGLGAAYAARFWILAWGKSPGEPLNRELQRRPYRIEGTAVGVGAAASAALGVLWLPGAPELVAKLAGSAVPASKTWELALSVGLVAVGLYSAVLLHRARVMGDVPWGVEDGLVADWFGIPEATKRFLVDPTLSACRALGTFDDQVVDAPARLLASGGRRLSSVLAAGDRRVVDAGVRAVARFAGWVAHVGSRVTEGGVDGVVGGVARIVGGAGGDVRRHHTGLAHEFYVVIALGTAALVAVTALLR